MALIGSVGKLLQVAALTTGLVALACPRAWSALLTETWQDHEQCEKIKKSGSVTQSCFVVRGGKFTIYVTAVKEGLTPTMLSDPTTNFYVYLGAPYTGTGTSISSSSLLGYSYNNTINSTDFKVKVKKTGTTATGLAFAKACNAQGKKCKKVQIQKIVLTITAAGELIVSISAITGTDANGDTFEKPVAAQTFDGDPTGPVTVSNPSLAFHIELGHFKYNVKDKPNVNVAGTVTTKPGKHPAGTTTSPPKLSDVKITATLRG